MWTTPAWLLISPSSGVEKFSCGRRLLWVNLLTRRFFCVVLCFSFTLLTDIFTSHHLMIHPMVRVLNNVARFRGYGHLLITCTARDHRHVCMFSFLLTSSICGDDSFVWYEIKWKWRGNVTWLALRKGVQGEFGALLKSLLCPHSNARLRS